MKIIFDFDGTLVDSMPALTSLAIDLFDSYGLAANEARSAYLSCIGLSFPEQLEELFPGHALNKSAAATFLDYQARIYETMHLHDGTAAVLGHLAYAGVPFAICTSSPASLTQNLYMQYSLPKPDYFLGRELGTKLDQLVRLQSVGYTHFIGDAPRDGKLAKDAKLSFMGVEHTFSRSTFKTRDLRSEQDLISAVDEVLRSQRPFGTPPRPSSFLTLHLSEPENDL